MGEREQVLKKIRKLLELANPDKQSADTLGEVEAAMKAARRLMDKYDIEENDIRLDEPEAAAGSVVEQEAQQRKGRVEVFDRDLACAVAELCEIGVYVATSRHRQRLIFYGFPRDVEVAKALHKQLRMTARTMARLVLQRTSWSREHTDYCLGFANAVYLRAARAKADVREETNNEQTTALALLKASSIEQYAKENLSLEKIRSRRHLRDLNDEAYQAGQRDGNNVSLSTNGIAQ